MPHDPLTRSCFIANPGNKIVATDYSAQEALILANFSKEPNLYKFYQDFPNASMHSYVASLIFDELAGVSLDDIEKNHKTLRGYAKSVGFSLAYGGGAGTIAKNCGVSKARGEEIYEAYFKAFPELKKYFDTKFYTALASGVIVYNQIDGRKYFLQGTDYWKYKNIVADPSFDKYDSKSNRSIAERYQTSMASIQRTCMNYPIQGSAASMSKLAGVIFFSEVIKAGKFGKVLIPNMIHDEFLLEAPESEIEHWAKVLEESMVKAGKIYCPDIPLKAVSEIGDYWIH